MRFEIDRNAAVGQDSSRARFALSLSILAAMLLAMLTVAPGASAQASDVYITPDGSGQGVCTSSPHNPAWFNSSGNWGTGAAQIGPGTTVHLCGTFTGSAGSTLLTFQGNGSSGNPVTLLFESGANLTAPYWGSSASAAINTNGKSYVTIDGGANGIIQNTANGTGLTYHQASSAIYVRGSSGATVKHLTISNICQHNSTSDTVGCNSGGNNDRAVLVSGSATNVSITLNTIHDSQNCIEYSGSGGDTGVLFSRNTIYHCNWGVGGYGGSNGLTIDGNDISSATNWDTGADSFHHNGIILFPQSTSMNHVVISNNYIHDINGTETAHIFLDPNSTGNLPAVLIYNNVTVTTTLGGPTNCFIEPGAHVSPAYVFNNTMSGSSACGTGVDPTGEIYNNVFVGMYNSIGIPSNGILSDYNSFYGLTGGSLSFTNTSNGIQAATLADWIAATGSVSEPCGTSKCDSHSVGADPSLTATFTLGGGSPAIGVGKNLTSLGVAGLNIGAPQFFGVNYSCGNGCVPRPATGNWDIGAYPASTTSSEQPSAPTALAAVVE